MAIKLTVSQYDSIGICSSTYFAGILYGHAFYIKSECKGNSISWWCSYLLQLLIFL